MKYFDIKYEKLNNELEEIKSEIQVWKDKNLSLDLTRGKPGKEQLDLSAEMLNTISNSEDCIAENGFDCRNYGILDGIPEAKKLFSDLLNIPEKNLIIAGNSSLNLMFDTIARAMIFGVYGGDNPWGQQGEIKFLCPCPGYDRHFAICESMGIKMIPIEMTPDGPDMNKVEELVSSDKQIKGMWCVPKFSNPEGYVYSDETVKRIAALNPAANDFRVFWDNAYAVHEIYDEEVKLLDIFEESKKNNNEDLFFYFASTSKISFPGSGVAIMAASDNNIAQIKPILSVQTIGFDKINQIRHVKYFKNADGIKNHMKLHASVIRPRFEMVINKFRNELSGVATWTEPKGGYFVDLSVPDGTAKRVYELCKETGLSLTQVGAAFPYKMDPNDRHLRIAPTFPSMDALKDALSILCLCVKQAAIELALKNE